MRYLKWRRPMSLHFKWTPDQILQLSLFDFDDYVAYVEALNKGG